MTVRTAFLALSLSIAVAAEAQINSGFGSSVAMEGDAIFVGKAFTNSSPGVVYVYGRDPETQAWVERQRLQASDAGDQSDHFGRTMVTGENTLYVGALGSDDGRGAVYEFILQDGMWIETTRLATNDGEEDHRFGNDLAVRGNWLLASAVGSSSSDGAVYVFERDEMSGAWSEHTILRGSDVAPYEEEWRRDWRMSPIPVAGFGPALALGDHTAAVAAPGFGGAVVLYTHDTESDAWSLADTLKVEGQKDSDLFGYALAMQGDELFVGAPRYSSNQGVVFVFERDSETLRWAQRGHLAGIFLGRGFRLLGFDLGADGHHLWTVAPFEGQQSGALYRYSRDLETGAVG